MNTIDTSKAVRRDTQPRKMNPNAVGFALGFVIGLMHLSWAAIVGLGWGQPVIDFIYHLHFLTTMFKVQPFDPFIAIVLVAVSSVCGYAFGFIYASIWNLVSERTQS
jgi:hypothetical protein